MQITKQHFPRQRSSLHPHFQYKLPRPIQFRQRMPQRKLRNRPCSIHSTKRSIRLQYHQFHWLPTKQQQRKPTLQLQTYPPCRNTNQENLKHARLPRRTSKDIQKDSWRMQRKPRPTTQFPPPSRPSSNDSLQRITQTMQPILSKELRSNQKRSEVPTRHTQTRRRTCHRQQSCRLIRQLRRPSRKATRQLHTFHHRPRQ